VPKVTPQLVTFFKQEQATYGTKVALHNYTVLLAQSLLQTVGVTGVKLKHARKKAKR
jgi:hypothetical protein